MRGIGLDIGEEKEGTFDWESYLRKRKVQEPRPVDL
uniref:Uncharacterized protein n=1 Tax=Siphoviridae sp. ctuUw41 TaxID=2826503 RepID=A0A8S5MYB9_9CAUD|nr:MAG TPA: hypothetical protein [Siphoviridae sp. ctuUw41]